MDDSPEERKSDSLAMISYRALLCIEYSTLETHSLWSNLLARCSQSSLDEVSRYVRSHRALLEKSLRCVGFMTILLEMV